MKGNIMIIDVRKQMINTILDGSMDDPYINSPFDIATDDINFDDEENFEDWALFVFGA